MVVQQQTVACAWSLFVCVSERASERERERERNSARAQGATPVSIALAKEREGGFPLAHSPDERKEREVVYLRVLGSGPWGWIVFALQTRGWTYSLSGGFRPYAVRWRLRRARRDAYLPWDFRPCGNSGCPFGGLDGDLGGGPAVALRRTCCDLTSSLACAARSCKACASRPGCNERSGKRLGLQTLLQRTISQRLEGRKPR